MYNIRKQAIILICICLLFHSFGLEHRFGYFSENAIDQQSQGVNFERLDDRLPYDPDFQNKADDTPYPEFDNHLQSSKSSRIEVPSGFDDFIPDESDDDRYSYAPGGFYLPSSKKSKLNYFIEEVKDDVPDSTQKNEPTKESVKGMKVLTGADIPQTQVTERPSFMSYLRKLFLNPKMLMAFAMIPLAFAAEVFIPHLGKIFSRNMLPVVTSTIASGLARSFDGTAVSGVDEVLDAINEYGARSMEDPRCFQRFFCQIARSNFESRSGDSWSVQKVIRKLAKTVDDRLWDSLGLKHLFSSLESGNCDSLVCTGTVAYAQNVSLFEKLRLLSAKLFNQTKVIN
ncbi:hypothetical protein AVEN_20852-1 [Araneus ventricosus]|uniref:Uncharacterized protein n=1 Tax=Araneus ventricosus TaxID=182803 RepID=A0A4Y2R420_ARAVE|nr:hypothetical protein AVEN_20852-1 [Araneus ventricosus]